MIKLSHKETTMLVVSGLFNTISSYDELEKAIVQYGTTKQTDDETRSAVGAAFEVFTEFFFKKFNDETLLGIKDIVDTSHDKYNRGLDFWARDLSNDRVVIQSKFRANPMFKFERSDLMSFVDVCDEHDIPKGNRRVLFTNLEHNVSQNSYGIFNHQSKQRLDQFRVIDRKAQQFHIDRRPDFWQTFHKSLKASLKKKKSNIPVARDHQNHMLLGCRRVMDLEIARGNVICATGGGKTLVEYLTLHEGFLKHDLNLQVIIAPTIQLLHQHHQTFDGYGMFKRDKVFPIHFRTGDDSIKDARDEYHQTTDEIDLLKKLDELKGRKIVIFVTYASEEKLFEIFRKNTICADTVVWDEFHHCVKQDRLYKEHLLSLPAIRNLFFSASRKHGNTISSYNVDIFGENVATVTYTELRQKAILVPNVIVKPLVINKNGKQPKAIEREMMRIARDRNFDAKKAYMEATAYIVARSDMLTSCGTSNIVGFSASVAICKEIEESKIVRKFIDKSTNLNAVYASTKAHDRKRIFQEIKNSTDSILCQHSIVKEGIDITPFNALIFSRVMEEIGTQQAIGRIVRAHPDDTSAFERGEIDFNDLTKWKKPSATIYILLNDDGMESFEERLKELLIKLQYTGLSDVVQFDEIAEERHGKDNDQLSWITKIVKDFDFKEKTLGDYAKKLMIEIEKDEEFNSTILPKIEKMTVNELIETLSEGFFDDI